jgi:hypothetical protein
MGKADIKLYKEENKLDKAKEVCDGCHYKEKSGPGFESGRATLGLS